MEWIKRNLWFLVGTIFALMLMGVAGWYLYSNYNANNELVEKLHAEYAELDSLTKQSPHPGNDKVDNIKTAREQEQQIREFIKQSRKYFQKIPPIPEGAKITDHDFSAALSRTIDQLQRDATNASVGLPPTYAFSFNAEKQALSFPPGSLAPLSTQLGEVKAITDILFTAKVNYMDRVRRERVSPTDAEGSASDYLDQRSVTNDLAVLTPYEVTFRGFSQELAGVLMGFASSPYGFIVKTVNVDVVPPAAASETQTMTAMVPQYVQPVTAPPARPMRPPGGETADDRYGGAMPSRPTPRPVAPPPVYAQTPAVAAASAASRGGLQTVLDQKQLTVTMSIQLVKLLSPAANAK